jgi:hypothetical protein
LIVPVLFSYWRIASKAARRKETLSRTEARGFFRIFFIDLGKRGQSFDRKKSDVFLNKSLVIKKLEPETLPLANKEERREEARYAR